MVNVALRVLTTMDYCIWQKVYQDTFRSDLMNSKIEAFTMHLEVLNEVVLLMEGKEKRVWIIKNELESSIQKIQYIEKSIIIIIIRA